MNHENSSPTVRIMGYSRSPTPETHPEVHARMIECDRLYVEQYGAEHNHLKVCSKLLCMGHPMTPERLQDLCRIHCRRWTYPF